MNSTIQAERQAKAIQAITEETARLGGELVLPTGRVPDQATRTVLTLEAIAEALKEIQLSGSRPRAETVDEFAERTKKPTARAKGNQ